MPGNQLLESDIVYIKDPLSLKQLTINQIKKSCLIAHYCFSSFDLCVYFILELINRNCLDKTVQQKYYEIISEKTNA